MTNGLTAPEVGRLRVGWAALCLIQIAIVGAGLVLGRGIAARSRLGISALLVVHALSQGVLTRPMVPTDEAAIYRRPARLLDRIPADAVLVHGGFRPIFGGDYSAEGVYPARLAREFERRAQAELFSFPALLAGRRMELDYSPDGLDSSLVHLLGQTMGSLEDGERLSLLRATGVDRILISRPLRDDLAGGLSWIASGGGSPPIRLYALSGSLRDAEFAGRVEFAPDVGAGFAALLAPGSDPRRVAVIAGEGTSRNDPPGRVQIERFSAERIDVEAESPAGGFVVVRRAWLPIWQVEVDGEAAEVRIANLTRLAVELPAGRHRVSFFVSRTPLRLSLLGSLAGIAGLLWIARRRPEPA
jgi:hypothetical protein